jgi:hypothetical protein
MCDSSEMQSRYFLSKFTNEKDTLFDSFGKLLMFVFHMTRLVVK